MQSVLPLHLLLMVTESVQPLSASQSCVFTLGMILLMVMVILLSQYVVDLLNKIKYLITYLNNSLSKPVEIKHSVLCLFYMTGMTDTV